MLLTPPTITARLLYIAVKNSNRDLPPELNKTHLPRFQRYFYAYIIMTGCAGEPTGSLFSLIRQ